MARYIIENGVIRYCPDGDKPKAVAEKPKTNKKKWMRKTIEQMATDYLSK